MKFRLLSPDELSELEPEFVQYLSAQSITADDWVKLKTSKPELVKFHLESFSDLVLEKVLGKINFLQHRSATLLKVFKLGADKTEMIGFEVEDSDIDFNKPESMQHLSNPERIKGSVRIFKMDKPHELSKEEEVFELLNSGCSIAQENMFTFLENMYTDSRQNS